MPYKRFEDLPVWQAGVDLAVRTYQMTTAERLKGPAGLKDQIERAALSVSNNIAEGFERGTTAELIYFLYIALGSTGEVRSMLLVLERLGTLDEDSGLAGLVELTRNISRQLCGWLESLKDSDAKGPRHTNSATRSATAQARRREEYLASLQEIQAAAKRRRESGPDDDPSKSPP